MNNRIFPTLAVVGYGLAGKDTACEWFRDHTPLRFAGGCSWAARHYMAERLSQDYNRLVTPEEAYATRHEHRQQWFDYMEEYRRQDPTRLTQLVLETSDVVCGPRGRSELLIARERGLLELIVWVENVRVPADFTVAFEREDADVLILNNTSLEVYYRRLQRLAQALKIPVH